MLGLVTLHEIYGVLYHGTSKKALANKNFKALYTPNTVLFIMGIKIEKETSLTLWSAIKLRIAGIANYITKEKREEKMKKMDENVAEIRELARKSEQAAEKSGFEEKLAKLEDRLDFYERTESLKAPNWGRPELLLEMLKVIANTYAAGEVDEAIQLLRDEN